MTITAPPCVGTFSSPRIVNFSPCAAKRPRAKPMTGVDGPWGHSALRRHASARRCPIRCAGSAILSLSTHGPFPRPTSYAAAPAAIRAPLASRLDGRHRLDGDASLWKGGRGHGTAHGRIGDMTDAPAPTSRSPSGRRSTASRRSGCRYAGPTVAPTVSPAARPRPPPRPDLRDRHPAAHGERQPARRPRLRLHPHRLHGSLQADAGPSRSST